MINEVVLSSNYVSGNALLWGVFAHRVMKGGFFRVYSYSWDTDESDDWAKILKQEGLSLHSNLSRFYLEVVIDISSELMAYLNLRRGSIKVTFASREKEPDASVTQAFAWLHRLYPTIDPPTPTEVRMRFWTNTRSGANDVSRKLDVPPWDTIDQNYALETQTALTGIMSKFRPAHGGQLILWHGVPGTGKTFALRALGLSWRNWCTVECVIDPEAFFGDAGYMMQVLLDTEAYESPGVEGDTKVDLWRLLILEDAGELLAEDARQRTGQGLSRLLNVADGLIGQGMRTLILVTTNEPLRKLHPAVARPGRCASEIEFKVFTSEEANTWLAARKMATSSKGSQTLAQLYSQVSDFGVAQGADLEPVGFRVQ